MQSDSWPPGGDDPELARLAGSYIGPENTLDLAKALEDPSLGRCALVSSFGAESAVLLHLVLTISPSINVIFLDTKKHFSETYEYVALLQDRLNIENLIIAEPDKRHLKSEDPNGVLYRNNSDSCCILRKTFPLQDALNHYDSWITGRKRYQGGRRSNLAYFERDGTHIKVNPLILWSENQVKEYYSKHDLPQHPLVASGFPSIGCQPCTRAVSENEDPRAGRWSWTEKVECGIHIGNNGTLSRTRRN